MFLNTRTLVWCAWCLLSATGLAAQGKKLTLEDCVLRQRGALAPERMAQLGWIPGTDRFAYVKKVNGAETLLSGGVRDEAAVPLLDLEKLNGFLRSRDQKVLERMPALTWLDARNVQFFHGGRFVRHDVVSGGSELLPAFPENAENHDQASMSRHTAFTVDNNLYVLTGEGKSIGVAVDGNAGLVYGKSVHREEYGIEKGTFWSPQGDKLAFYRMDQRMVSDYPILELGERPATARMIKYPMAGMSSHEVTIGVFDVKKKKTVYLKTEGPKDQYLTNVCWGPDGKTVYVAVLNRRTDHLWLNAYDAQTGRFLKTLFEEAHDKYVEPLHPMAFVPGAPDRFVWQSQRSGHNHLYLYGQDGQLVRPLTSGDWDVAELHGFSADGSAVYVTAATNKALERHYGTAELSTGRFSMLTTEAGVHVPLFNANGFFIDQYSSTSVPREIRVCDPSGRPLRTLLSAANPLEGHALGQMRLVELRSPSGLPLNGRIILPPGFDSTKRYPSITYVYNGPHVQLVSNAWLGQADLWQYYLAQEGFVVFTLDGRGSMNRGAAFERDHVHRQLGTAEIEDQLVGNDYLRGLPFIDTLRMGVNGWSYGGFMTIGLMTRTPGRYQVGVAGGPVIDWRFYEVMYTERYMDTPEENPQGYEQANLLNHVQDLRGDLMLIHGTSDDVVVWQHSLQYLEKCVEKGKLVDYLVYPGHLHNVLGPDRVHLLAKMTDYFKDRLNP
jgi:dipeptidyl-peptidase-4